MPVSNIDISSVAVTFQALGTLLLALVLGQIARTFGWRYVHRWAWAWGAMFLSVVAVRVFLVTFHRWPWWLLYLLGQWLFLLLLYVGCRDLADDPLPRKLLGYVTPLMAALAVFLVAVVPDLEALFLAEAAIVTLAVGACYLVLGRITHYSVGWYMMRLSLALFGFLYLTYVPLYAFQRRGIVIPYLNSSSLADLLAAVLLGYGMVLIASEAKQRELTDAVGALQMARDQLAIKANTDPLTAALSRHAFHAMPREMSGVVVMVDVDRLKSINDIEGHAAGDDAIRAVANAIRQRIRADDLLFRWGGDEFLVVMPQSPLALVRQRFVTLDQRIDTPQGKSLTVSWGASAFASVDEIDEAIRDADRLMYARKAETRAS